VRTTPPVNSGSHASVSTVQLKIHHNLQIL